MNPYANLLYARQYIFCRLEIPELSGWNHLNINGYLLYTHPDLTVSSIKTKSRELYLLGTLFDHTRINASNEEILEKLIKSETFEELLQTTENYTGRFILIFKQNLSIRIFHDPSGARKIYYYMHGTDFCFASQPFLIANYFKLQRTKRPEILQFYENTQFAFHEKTGILNSTIYEPLKRLLPNWYIDVDRHKVIRFWPYRILTPISLNEGVESTSTLLKGFIKNIHHRNKLTMALTSGNDSRLLLAASRDISDDVFYYVLHHSRMDENNSDLVIHRKILNSVHLKEHVISYDAPVDEDFKEIYFKNNEFASESYLPIIYNFIFKQCPGKLNLVTTVSDLTRNFFQTTQKIITPELLSRVWYYGDNPYVIERYRSWLTEIGPLASEYNYSILDLFNWEERIGVWNVSFQSDSDMVRDEASPYCSRRLLEIMLSVPSKYRDFNTNIFYRTMIKQMWPELAKFPYNPVWRKRVGYTLKKAKVYWMVRSVVRGW